MNQKIERMFHLFFELYSLENTTKLIDCIDNHLNKGVILSGVGKNWYICEKVAKTFISMGIPTQTLDPVHALHGDIGMIKEQTMIFISKSGSTIELVTLIKYLYDIKKKGIVNPKMVSISLKEPSTKDFMDICIYPTQNNIYEFDSKNIIPTLSINIIQMLLDWIGVTVFEKNPFLQERYPYNHPGGSIGNKLGTDKLI